MKSKKLVECSLAVALVFGAAALTGCNKDKNTVEKTEQEKVYDLYVAYMSAKGETPDSYETWLNNVKGPKGDKGDQGQPGTAGKDGATWFTGSEDPASSLGKVGDLYLKTSTSDVFVKSSTGWSVTANIKGGQGEQGVGTPGAAGERGNSLLTGTGEPGANLGKTGDTYLNKTNYDLYEKGAQGWELIGNIKGAQGNQGIPGVGTPGETGASVSNVDVAYERGNDGKDYMVFTFTYTDSRQPEVVRVEMPKKIVDVQFDGETTFAVSEPGTEPTLRLFVIYEGNGQSEYVTVTEDMFVVDNEFGLINFQQEGTYHVKINYAGYEIVQDIIIASPNAIANVDIAYPQQIMVIKSGQVEVAFENNYVSITRASGAHEQMSIADAIEAQIISVETSELTTATSGDIVNLDLQYENGSRQLTVKVIDEAEFAQAEWGYNNYNGGNEVLIMVGDQLADLGAHIEYRLYDNQMGDFSYIVPVTESLLKKVDTDETLDTSVRGYGQYNIDETMLPSPLNGSSTISVIVYEASDIMEGYGSTSVKVGEGSYSDLYVSYQVTVDGHNSSIQVNLDQSMIVEGSADFNSAGEYEFVVEYQGARATISVSVYDPAICNISYISIQIYDLNMVVGSDVEAFLTEYLIGQNVTVSLYEPVDGSNQMIVPITREMIDLTGFSADSMGDKTINIKYSLPGQEEYSEEVYVTVIPDMTNASIVKQATMNDPMMGEVSFKFYDNGIVERTMDGSYTNYTTYIEDEGMVWLCEPEFGINTAYSLTGDDTNGYEMAVLVPTGEANETSYSLTIDLGEEVDFTLEVYTPSATDTLEVGSSYYATLKFAPAPGYEYHYATVRCTLLENNRFEVYGNSGVVYQIGANNVLTLVTE